MEGGLLIFLGSTRQSSSDQVLIQRLRCNPMVLATSVTDELSKNRTALTYIYGNVLWRRRACDLHCSLGNWSALVASSRMEAALSTSLDNVGGREPVVFQQPVSATFKCTDIRKRLEFYSLEAMSWYA
ncbi:hypothetical protein BJ508DRAFT_118383 [Ascobolus immersus RN42]|uniref:Uncharacterized protein n=1 Tax=Ascobolus immersus RN42 TaxID=1160509 RepID=A0A3N4I4J4_ASCIM|nr:hypothetical protein BJ508DRAFT_118383 [Ascobolus immersus RN42]